MPSIVKFSGNRDDSLLVSEHVEEIADLISSAGRGPIRLTRNIGTPVFINAERIAYWHEYTRGRVGFDSRRVTPQDAPVGPPASNGH
jgi:hypothetical protein